MMYTLTDYNIVSIKAPKQDGLVSSCLIIKKNKDFALCAIKIQVYQFGVWM